MKPLKLTISAFGSYLNKTVIDFRKLGENGIYLITGDTGAGKTTIFDAITYALYGTGSGDLRSGKLFRSKYAALDDETYVELEFLYKDEKYIIRRNPDYERLSKNGKGLAKQKASELLTMPDGSNITGAKNVNDKITRLIGIDARQFRQIVMLPQGAFMNFIMADTSNKQKIFADIFKTHLYSLLQDKIKEDAKVYRDKIEQNKNIISRSIKEVICPSSSEAYEYMSGLSETIDNSDSFSFNIVCEKIDLINSEETVKKSKYNSELALINELIENINKKLGIQKINENLRNNIEKGKKIIESENSVLVKLEDILKKATDNLTKVSEYEILISEIEKQFSLYKEKDELIKEYNKSNDLILKTQMEIDKIISSIESENSKIESMEKEEAELEFSEDLEINLNKELHTIQTALEKVTEISDMICEYNQKEAEFKKAQKEFSAALAKYEAQRDNYCQKESLYDNSIAGILADKLRNGEMKLCPVCGSDKHPVLAVKPSDTPTEQELEDLKRKLSKYEEKKNKCREKVNSLESVTQLIFSNICKNTAVIFEKSILSVDEISEKVNEEKNSLLERKSSVLSSLNELKTRKERLKKIAKLIELMQNDISSYNTELEKLKDEISKHNENALILKTRYQAIELKYDNLESAKNECTRLKNSIKDITQKHEDALKSRDNCRQKIFDAQTSVKTSQEQIVSEDMPEISELNRQLEENKTKREEVISLITVTEHILETNEGKKKNIKKYGKAMENDYENYAWIKELSDLVNGNIKKLGVEQINLETRVQMICFARILRKANIHLLQMTSGQYELVRARESADGRKKAGLDLNIFDHYSQSERDVKTLSGGETFMASLALAFGMADEIQSSAGGIEINTMFIDEGFGALDDEALNQAVKMLDSLVRSNRLIGIISHVSELKNRIDKKIIVTKNNSAGSKVEIVV